MMPLGTPSQVSALRARMWDAGFRPVPIYNPDADHPSAGKAPMGERWGDEARADPPGAVRNAAHPAALNTGVLADGLRAIDIDIDNPTIAASVKAKALDMFGEAPMRYRANSSRVLLLYRAAAGTPSKRSISGDMGKVEVLGRGQQFVAFGVHPSGADLHWMPDAPGDIAADDLPALTEAQIDAFLDAVAPSVGAKAPTPQTTPPRASQRGLGADPLQVIAALSAIPNDGPPDWEAWNRIGMATWAATGGGEAGRAAFHAWSQANPAYDPTETNARWDHYATSPPTQIGAGTLFYLSRGVQRELDDAPLPDAHPDEQDPAFWQSLERSLYDVEETSEVSAEVSEVSSEVRRKSGIIDPRDWTAPAPLREWIVDGWIPRGYVTGLYGDGAMGKSLICQQLLTSVAMSLPWLGMSVHGGRAFGFMCEDDEDELHRRQEGINKAYGVGMPNLENLRYTSRVGADNLLMTFDERTNRGTPTELMGQLCDWLRKYRPTLVVLDTLADIFGGDEIRRAQARQFIQGVGGNIAREFACGVVIAAHPSQAGLASGKGTGGSTAWNNTFRSRLYLTKPEGENRDDERLISRMKANYSSTDGGVALRWGDGCFVPTSRPEAAALVSWADTRTIFEELIRAWNYKEPWSNAPQTRKDGRYFPLWAFTTMGLPERLISTALEQWMVQGFIRVVELDRKSKTKGMKVVGWPSPPIEEFADEEE